MEERLRKLKNKRAAYKGTITRVINYLKEIENEAITNEIGFKLEARKKLAIGAYEEICKIQLQIEEIDENDSEQVDEIETKYIDVLSSIDLKLALHNQNNQSNSSTTFTNTNQNNLVSTTKLPHINIPTFDGKNLSKYKPFYDMFIAVIDKNVQLSEVEKLFYLRNYLKGEALSLVNNMPITNASYKEALNILDKRYKNEFMIINSHIQALLDIPAMTKGTAIGIREFVSKIKQEISALKILNQPIDKWDMMLICVLSKKLDLYTCKSYQFDRDSTKLPTLDEFLEFLENRATALEAATGSESKGSKQLTCNIATDSIKAKREVQKCCFCNTVGHKLYNCIHFKNKTSNERSVFINDKKLCKICLNSHKDKCKLNIRCQVCNKNHNTLVHVEQENLVSLNCNKDIMQNVLLPTIKVKIKSNSKKYIYARALLDTGSQSCLCTNNLVNQLKVSLTKNNTSIVGISGNEISIGH